MAIMNNYEAEALIGSSPKSTLILALSICGITLPMRRLDLNHFTRAGRRICTVLLLYLILARILWGKISVYKDEPQP